MRGGSTGHWQTTFRSSSVYGLISKESSRSRRALPTDSGVSKLIFRHEMELVQQSEGGNGHSFHAGYGVADRSFGVYLFHAPILVGLMMLFRFLPQNLYFLVAILVAAGLCLSFSMADIARRIPSLRAIV